MAIYFFDKNQTLIKIVPESATFEAIQTQELDDDSLLKDTLSVTVKGDEKLLNAEYMAVKSYTGNAQTFDMYRIVTDTTPDKSMSFTGMSLAPYELNGYIIQDLRPANHSLSYTLNRVLDGTDWRVGYIDDGLSNVTTTFYYVSAKEALKELQSLVGCEFVFKVEISGQKITDKWIEVYSEMGNRTKKRFNYGTNALTVVRETNKADIYTALIGRGKGEEVSSGEDNASGQAGYGRKITFEDIEWEKSSGKPLDKPKGQYYLELPQATQAYGIKNIDGTMKARVGIVDFGDEEDKNRLINLTYQQLLVSSRPKVLFKTTVANIGATGIGDTVTIHRHDLNIHYQTRVRKIVRNKLNDNKTQIELGDAVVTASTKQTKRNNATIKNLNQEIERVKVSVTTSQNSADGKNTIFYGSAVPERQRTGDTWYRPHPSIAGETQMLTWNGTAWELVLDTSDLTSVSREVKDAIDRADEAKGLAVSEAESALAQAKSDATAKANAIKEQITGEVNTAITTAEDAKSLAVSEAERMLAQAKADATAKANAVKEQVSGEVNTAINTANDAKQTAIDNYNNAVAEAERLVGEQTTAFDTKFGEIEDSVSAFNQSVSDVDAKAEAIKQGLGLSNTNLTNQQITEQIRQEFNSLKSTADTAKQSFIDLNNEYQTFLTDRFNPALTKATDALSLAEQNEGLFYSANLIDEVTGLSNVYTKAEIDGTNGYVTKATFKANADTISSEFERIEGVALASGANINLLVTRNQKVNTWLDTNPSSRNYPTPNDTTNATATSPDLISVTAGENITLSKTTVSGDNGFRIDFLDSNKVFVSRLATTNNTQTITIPANVAYLWVSYPMDSYPKIERGEVKTQWTLAPQDQVNQSTVNYLTSKIEQTPGLISEALTSYTKTDSLDETVSSYLTNDTTKTANAIKTKLSDYQTTSNLDGDIVRLLDNTTTQTAGKFNNKLQALEGKIPTEFGGRNLLRGTADFDTTLWRNVSTAMPSTRDARYKQVRVDGDFNVAPITTMGTQGWNFEVGKDYVVSVYAKSEVLGNKLGLTAQNTAYFEPQVVAMSEWRRYVWKFKATTSGLANFRFETRNGERVWITQPQIEKGSIPTDWTRAVEDLATVVQTNEIERTANYTKSAITNVTASGLVTGSTINQTKDGITERVARLDTNGNVAYSNREVKLDSIVSTVANDRYISNIIQASDLVQSTIRENTNVDLLAKAASGTGMTADPNFNKGINGLIVYDNGNTNTISIYRNLTNDPNLPSGKGYRLDIYHASSTETSPYRGGVVLPTKSWANGVVVVRFTAKLEIGKSFVYAQNLIGTGSTHGWLTSNKGTGKWEQYAYYYRFGTSGTFQTFGFLTVNATSAAFTWRLADFDIINLGLSSQSQITQLQDNIDLKVSDENLLSRINVRAGGVLITSGTNKLNITPDTTYIQDATIKSAMIESIDVKQIKGIKADFTTMVTNALTANTITSTMINANDAMFEKLFSNTMATTKLAAQEAWIKSANIVSLDAGKIKTGTIDTARLDAKKIVTGGLDANVVKSTHIESSTGLIDKIFADEALIIHLTSNTIFASKIKAIEIDASKITSGELDAARIKSKDVVTAGLSANVVESKHIKAEVGLVDKIFSKTAYIEELTNKSIFTEKIQAINISADKITTGTLDAGKVKVINIDAENITSNKTSFIQSNWNDISSSIRIDASGLLSTASDGSQVYLQNGVVGVRRPQTEGGGSIGQIGYVYDGGSPTYTIRTTWGSHFGLKQVFYDSFKKATDEKRVMYASTADDGVTTVQFYANDFILHQRKINFGFAHYINGADTNLSITGQKSITLRANESTIFIVSNDGTSNFATLHANLNMAGNTVTNTSDIRLKRDIVNDEIDSLSALLKWQHAGFNYINPEMNQDRQYGVIAQSAPDLSSIGEDGYLQVSLNKQVNMTSHALQQHVNKTNAEIKSLKAQIASLQDELALLKGD